MTADDVFRCSTPATVIRSVRRVLYSHRNGAMVDTSCAATSRATWLRSHVDSHATDLCIVAFTDVFRSATRYTDSKEFTH